MNYEEFYSSPKNFGGAARFVQLIAKYTIEIASQIAFDLKIEWKNYPQLFQGLQQKNIIDAELCQNLKKLSEFYLPKTLINQKIRDVFEMILKAQNLIDNYSKQISKYIKT
jgi:hypothetical protein